MKETALAPFNLGHPVYVGPGRVAMWGPLWSAGAMGLAMAKDEHVHVTPVFTQ